jgi:hypothetical protein
LPVRLRARRDRPPVAALVALPAAGNDHKAHGAPFRPGIIDGADFRFTAGEALVT